MRTAILSLIALVSVGPVRATDLAADKRPNVVMILTDDQGYGDLSCHDNPVLRTPQLDQLYADALRLTDYHVSPTCSATRAALLTGRWSNRTGVWHTIAGRSLLRRDEVTVGQMFHDAGYATGMFGKWHLGDNYPFRPEDRGFDEVLRHGGGGVGQTPDWWNNAYFDGRYWHNGVPVPVEGFCTDVFFDYAKRFIRESKNKQRPFFAYVATNAPHAPMHSPAEFARPYADQPLETANFFGMIANIDENVGAMRQFLRDEGLERNTIFIFTTDNGSAAGWQLFNAGMRGSKGSAFDGGHRVPFFIHWPDGELAGGRDVRTLTGHVDIVPTLLDLCGIPAPDGVRFDGRSLARLLRGENIEWPDRILITDSQRLQEPIRWRQSAVMTSRWRLINGTQLYDLPADPAQRDNIAAAHPDVVKRLRLAYEDWWSELEPTFANVARIQLGHPRENPARLTSHDWITADENPWNQAYVRSARNEPEHTGYWNVHVVEQGRYSIRLRRWPQEADAAINAALPPARDVPGEKAYRTTPGRAIDAATAHVEIAGATRSATVAAEAEEVVFELQLPAGDTRLNAWFETADGEVFGAFYAYVARL